jgi:FAD-linked oxidoreductase
MPVWKNWAGDQVCAPARIVTPGSEAELADVVGSSDRVKAVGSGHSFTDAACTDGTMVSLGRMASIVDVDRSSGLVEVQGGMSLGALGKELARHGLAMENLGDVSYQTIAGAISTATHGTGLRYPNLSGQVAGMRLVLASGEVVDDAELLAARVGLGALGVISTVTLRCVPAFTLQRTDDPRPLADVLANLPLDREHFEFFVFPYTRVALTRTTERVPDAPPSGASIMKDVLLENASMWFINRTGRLTPRFVSQFPKFVSREVRVNRSDLVFANTRLTRFTEMEYAIPIEHAAEALQAVLGTIESRRLPIGFPIEVRFVGADDAWLGTAYGRDTAYLACHVYRGRPYESYFRAVEAIMDGYGGRPHWGKRHFQSAATLRPRYPKWDDFQAVRARLDPDRKFANAYLDRVL